MIFDPTELDVFRSHVTRADEILISTHVHPDADAIGSALAIREILVALGAKPQIVLEEGCPPRYRFLSGSDSIRDFRTLAEPHTYLKAVIVDSGGRDRIGRVNELLAGDCWIANLDHHFSNSKFGAINWVETTCAATGELLYELNTALGLPLSTELSNYLYAGILTDTGRFRYSNTTSRTMQVVADLIDHGADVFHLTDQFYYSISAPDILSMGIILSSLELFSDGLVSTLFVKRENLVEDPDTLVDLALSIRGVEAAAMFSETHDGKIRISLRSKHYVNVAEIAGKFGGGGHVRAAGCRMRGTLETVRDIVLPVIQQAALAGANQTGETAL